MQRLQVVMRQLAFDHLIDDAADAQRLVVACKAQAGVKALVDRLVAAVAREYEINRRQHAQEIEFVHDRPAFRLVAFHLTRRP